MRLTVDVETARQVVGDKLAPREWHVFLRALHRERQDKTAHDFGITQSAIALAKRRVLDKLKLSDEFEMWIYAVQSGIVKVD